MSVIWYHSDEPGAPTLNNAAGSVINVLDACLINGFNLKSVTSIVVASNVATVTCSAHGYETGKVVLIAGATPSGLNGEKRVTFTGTNTFTFPTSGISDQTATGTITVKRPGLGWTKAHTGTNKAIYARTDPAATTMMLRVDDTNTGVASTTYARIVGVESATDVDTIGAQFPTSAQLSGGGYLPKGANTSTAKPWILVGDELTFYFFTDDANYPATSYGGALHPTGFGDIVTLRAGDAYHCFIGYGNANNGVTGLFNGGQLTTVSGTGDGFSIARAANQLGSSVFAGNVAYASSVIGSSGNYPPYPGAVTNGAVFQYPTFVRDTSGASGVSAVRGYHPGVFSVLNGVGSTLHKTVLNDVVGLSRELLLIGSKNQSNIGCIAFDVTGPWR